MKFDFEELNPGTFFPFEESNPEEGVFVRVLNGEMLERITKATQIKKTEVKGNPPTRFTYFDYKQNGEEKEFEMTWDYCIVDWKGVVDAKGNAIPCTTENKVKLMKGSANFSKFIADCAKAINEANVNSQKEQEKNLSST